MHKDFNVVVARRLILDKIQSFDIENVFWDCPSHHGFKSISTVGWEAYANGGNRVDWPGLGPTGDAATAKGAPFTPNTLPLPLPC